MLILVKYERRKLIYTKCHVITSHKLGGCAIQNSRRMWHMRKLPHNKYYSDPLWTSLKEVYPKEIEPSLARSRRNIGSIGTRMRPIRYTRISEELLRET